MSTTHSLYSPAHGTLDALAVVSNPARYARKTQLRILAWSTLKADRGQTVIQHRLSAMSATKERTVAR